MGKKRTRKKYVSAGAHSNVSAGNKFNLWSAVDRALFKVKARAAGKRICESIPNPDKSNTKARFIKVCHSGR